MGGIGQQDHVVHAELGQNLRADAIIALLGRHGLRIARPGAFEIVDQRA